MPRFIAPPPDRDSRKAIEQRSRDATRPVVAQANIRWPFSVRDMSEAQRGGNKPEANAGQSKKLA